MKMRAIVSRAYVLGFGVLGVLGGIAVGCSSDDRRPDGDSVTEADVDAGTLHEDLTDPRAIAKRVIGSKPELSERFSKKPVVSLRPHGAFLFPHRAEGDVGRSINFTFPSRADGAFSFRPIDDANNVFEWSPLATPGSRGELDEDGRAIYRNAFQNADLIVSADADRVNHTIVLRDEQTPDLFSWRWKVSEGLFPKGTDDERVAILDSEGVRQVSIGAATIVDAAGKTRSSLVSLGSEGLATLIVDHSGLTFPVVVDFAVFGEGVTAMAAPPTIIKGRALVLLDTSGSMLWHFADNDTAWGDSDSSAVFCDNNIGTGFACNSGVACTTANGGLNAWPTTNPTTNPSRLYAAKSALQNVLNQNSGLIDFGLERFIESADCPNTANPAYCCTPRSNGTTSGRCVAEDWAGQTGYFDIPGQNDITFTGSCGSTAGGGRILVMPGPGSGTQMMRWVDYVEDFCALGATTIARNPELRGSGSTPLGRAIINARNDWYKPIYDDSRQPGTQPNDDPLIDCRPYSLIVMSDGEDNCSNAAGQQTCTSDSQCGSNNCFDSDSGNGEAFRCACSSNAQCASGICNTNNPPAVDCYNNNDAACVSGNCVDGPGANNNNHRCACSSNAQCATGEVCNTSVKQAIECNNQNSQCASGSCVDIDAGGGTTYRCACSNDASCGNGATCVRATAASARFVCSMSNQCNPGRACVDTNPNQGGTQGGCSCTNDSHCPSTQYCDTTASVPHCKYKYCETAGVCEASGICMTPPEPRPHERVQELTDTWQPPPGPPITPNPVKTYVLGMGLSYQTCDANTPCAPGATCTNGRCSCTNDNQCLDPYECESGLCSNPALDVPELEAMAIAGGTTQARFAKSKAEIEAAFADIVAQTVKYEICNAADDNCNGRADEGLGVYQECTAASECGSNDCDLGRCTCTNQSQCAAGYACSGDGFCRPACSVGQGICQRSGVKKCGAAPGQCCEADASPTCNLLSPGAPGVEVCNKLDDNCNGSIDEGLNCPVCIPTPEICDGEDQNCNLIPDDGVVVGQPCGTDIGECTAGVTACPPGGPLTCVGGQGPTTEVCNGLDDDCNNVIDGMTRACYTGPAGTENVGVCHAGTQLCTAVPGSGVEQWGSCVGQKVPSVEVCNGLNDDCDCVTGSGEGCEEAIDEGIPVPGGGGAVTGDPCCAPGTVLNGDRCCVPGHDCDTDAICTPGTWQCTGSTISCVGAVAPVDELCDSKDNDCNGLIDDLPGQGTTCKADNACAGTFECDYQSGTLKCAPSGTGSVELCNNIDDDCDGSIDEEPDVLDDPALQGECNVPPEGTVAPCKPGRWVCKAGTKVCEGDVQPRTEICNGKDDDCDGVVDLPNPCPSGQCMNGFCAEPCQSGEFPCPGGLVCQEGYCVPIPDGTGSGGASNASGGSTGSGDGGTSSGGSKGSGGASDSGGTSNLGEGGEDSGTGARSGSSNSSTGGSVTKGTDYGAWGLATGGGGCGCRVGGKGERVRSLAPFMTTLFAFAALRRRRSRIPAARCAKGGVA
jgi:hypothetical protein